MGIFGIGLPELLMISILVVVIVLHATVVRRAWRRETKTLFKALWTFVIVGIPFVGAGLYMFLGSAKMVEE